MGESDSYQLHIQELQKQGTKWILNGHNLFSYFLSKIYLKKKNQHKTIIWEIPLYQAAHQNENKHCNSQKSHCKPNPNK